MQPVVFCHDVVVVVMGMKEPTPVQTIAAVFAPGPGNGGLTCPTPWSEPSRQASRSASGSHLTTLQGMNIPPGVIAAAVLLHTLKFALLAAAHAMMVSIPFTAKADTPTVPTGSKPKNDFDNNVVNQAQWVGSATDRTPVQLPDAIADAGRLNDEPVEIAATTSPRNPTTVWVNIPTVDKPPPGGPLE